jgi:hypothetical protein
MQQISNRERILLRAGVLGAILLILWAFGRLGGGPAVVH